jgi:Ecdysteroid kinase-like family
VSVTSVVDVDGLSAEWLSEALSVDVKVHACERIGTGQTAATYRLEVVGAGLPDTLVAKVATGSDDARKKVRGGVRAEVGFYSDLLSTVDVSAPTCWYSAVSADALCFTLLLEDLAPRVPGVQVDGCSVSRAQAAIRNLAGLHAPRWNDETLFEHRFLRRSNAEGAAFLGATAVSATEVFVQRYGEVMAEVDVDTLQEAAARVESWLITRPVPFSLIHGDYRLDNLMFAVDTDAVVAVDWQTINVGLPGRDLAYFLGTSLNSDARRSHERDLVGAYHQELLTRGVRGYRLEQCFDDYRLGQLQGPMITTIGAAFATSERSVEADEMFLAMARRSCSAVRDLDSLALV